MPESVAARPTPITFEHHVDPLGVGATEPRLSWTWPTASLPSAFEVELADDNSAPHRFIVAADDNVLMPWPIAPLTSRARCSARVRGIVDNQPGDWSDATTIETGLLELDDWSARFIGPTDATETTPILFRDFELPDDTDRGRLYVTYLGIGHTVINGTRVGVDELAPGWTDYGQGIAVSTYDVADVLRPGLNRIEIHLSPGWYAGRVGFLEQRNIYGDHVGAIAQLEWARRDGTPERLETNAEWSWRRSAVTAADLYDGEHVDARRDAEFAQEATPVVVLHHDRMLLEPRLSPPVRVQETRRAQDVIRTPTGRIILDFGQNVVGRVRFRVTAKRGTVITLRHAEVLEDSELGVRPLRSAAATDSYTCAGTGQEEWAPSFTYHGFRYVEVAGWPGGTPHLDDILAEVLHSEMRRIGWFSTSHAGLARLHDNVLWSTRGNFVSIPTDCPQRDERLGWTGDIAVFAATANYLFDTSDLLQSWLRDLSREQQPDGTLPYFVPSLPFPAELHDNPLFHHSPTAVWGDAATIVPTRVYQATGDSQILAAQFDTMVRWVDAVEQLAGPSRVWDQGFQYGDWLDPYAPSDRPAAGATETALVATAYFAYSAELTSDAAHVLGREDDAARYRALASEVKTAFAQRFVRSDGRLTSDSQTAYAIALQLDLLDASTDVQLGERLVALVRDRRHRVGTGFVGTPLILQALQRVGALDDAYQLLLQTECPSWLYAVRMGATTIWERWDSMLPDGSINPGEMTSFNHYAFGAVADWLHSTVGGLAPLTPGWQKVRIAPRPGGDVRDAYAAHVTPYGLVSVDWHLELDELVVDVIVPAGVTAEIDLPGRTVTHAGAGAHTFRVPSPTAPHGPIVANQAAATTRSAI